MTSTRVLGPYKVPAVGLGCMPLSGMPPSKDWILKERDTAIGVIQAALDAGVRLLDTSDIYAPTWNSIGHNEILVAEAVRTWNGTPEEKDAIVIATKGGITRAPEEGNWFGVSGRDASEHYLYRAVEASAAKMQLSTIKLWQHHRLNHFMPFEEQFENVMKLKAPRHKVVSSLFKMNGHHDHERGQMYSRFVKRMELHFCHGHLLVASTTHRIWRMHTLPPSKKSLQNMAYPGSRSQSHGTWLVRP